MQSSEQKKTVTDEIDRTNSRIWENLGTDLEDEVARTDEIINLSRKISYKRGIADAYLNRGWCHSELLNLEEAQQDFKNALSYYTELDSDEGIMKSLNGIGSAYIEAGFHEKALEYYLKAYELSVKTGNLTRKEASLSNIAHLYFQTGNINESAIFFQEALNIAEKTGHPEHTAVILTEFAELLLKSGQPETALISLNRALEIIHSKRIKRVESTCLNVLGKAYMEKGEYLKAEEFFSKSIKSAEKQNLRSNLIKNYISLGELYFLNSSHEEARKILLKALDLTRDFRNNIHLSSIYENLYSIEKSSGNYKEALHYHELMYETLKSIHSDDIKKKLSVLSADSKIKQAESEKEIYRLKNVELKKNTEDLQNLYENISTISKIGQRITSLLDLNDICKAIYENVNRLMDASVFGVAVYNSEEREIEYKYFREKEREVESWKKSVDANDSFAGYCIRKDTGILVNDLKGEQSLYVDPELFKGDDRINSLIYIPLKIEKRIIGVITVQSYEKNIYTENHLNMLKALGSYIAVAMANSSIHQEVVHLNSLLKCEKSDLEKSNSRIEYLANHDPLTGLPNRRLLDKFIEMEIEKSKLSDSSLAFFYMDLDLFKEINDMYGHETGDEVLVETAGRLTESLRRNDIVGRLGGDEFLAIISDINDRNDCIKIAEKIIGNVGKEIKISGNACRIGISIGISIFPADGCSADEIFTAADNAMYKAKNAGRNSYEFHSMG